MSRCEYGWRSRWTRCRQEARWSFSIPAGHTPPLLPIYHVCDRHRDALTDDFGGRQVAPIRGPAVQP